MLINYNTAYLDIHYALLVSFLLDAEDNLLDVSYRVENQLIAVQAVVVAGTVLSPVAQANAIRNLAPRTVTFTQIPLSRALFNSTKGDWAPTHYAWLPYLLFSKAEAA